MGWKEAQERYRNRQSLSDQNTEDLIARRVLSGLGYKSKDINLVELSATGEISKDTALWVRVQKILVHVFRNLVTIPAPLARCTFEAYNIKTEKDILDRMEGYDGKDEMKPVFMTRISGTQQALAYFVWDKCPGEWLNPPYTVIKMLNNNSECLIVQDIEQYIKQFVKDNCLGVY